MSLKFKSDQLVNALDTDRLLFFALSNIYPKKSDTEITQMLGWAKRRLKHYDRKPITP